MVRFLALLALLVCVLPASGCLVPVQAERCVQPPPVGMSVDPSDPNKGWINRNGDIIYFTLTPQGWAVERTVQQAPTPATNTVQSEPESYRAMMEFLDRYDLPVEAIDVITRNYNLMQTREKEAENTAAMLESLKSGIPAEQSLDDEAVERARRMREINHLVE